MVSGLFCPRLHLEKNGSCVFAFPSCEIAPGMITSCNSPSSCSCYKECELEWMYPGKQVAQEEFTRHCFEGGPLADPSEAHQRPWRFYNLTRRTKSGSVDTWTTERAEDGKTAPAPNKIIWRWLNDTEASIAKDQRCLNGCSGGGQCREGMCECGFNRTGIACEIDHLGRLVNNANGSGGFVYIYDLPPGLTVWRQNYQTTSRDTAMDVIEALLSSHYRTLDPIKAALFFLPIAPQTSIQSGYALLAMEHVMLTQPYYNRSNGRDHVTIWSGDPGSCHVALDPFIRDTIKVSHFGLKGKSKIMGCDCELCGAGADVVVPDVMEGVWKALTSMKYNQPDHSPRDVFLFYSGSRTSPFRDVMFDVLLNKTRLERLISSTGSSNLNISIFDLTSKTRMNHGPWFKASKYCLDPPGAGFSTRGNLAIILGCVPVFIGEFNRPFFNTGGSPLNYSKFSITIRKRSIDKIFDILSQYNYTALKENLDKVWHHFSWASLPYGPGRLTDEPLESDALATTLDALCRHRKAKLPSTSPLLNISCSSKVQYHAMRENVTLPR